MQSYNYLQDAQLRAAFAYFDKDGSGAITKEELRTCLQSEEFTMTEEEIQKLLSGVDANGDEQIDYIEFITMMKSIWKLSKSHDRSATEDWKFVNAPSSILIAEMAAMVSFKIVEGDHKIQAI